MPSPTTWRTTSRCRGRSSTRGCSQGSPRSPKARPGVGHPVRHCWYHGMIYKYATCAFFIYAFRARGRARYAARYRHCANCLSGSTHSLGPLRPVSFFSPILVSGESDGWHGAYDARAITFAVCNGKPPRREEVINYLLKGTRRIIKADFTTPCATSPVLSLSRRLRRAEIIGLFVC